MANREAAAAPRLHVERLQGFLVHGWVWDPATPGQEVLALESAGRLASLPMPVLRSERADVDAALGVSVPGVAGFCFELPATIWPMLGPDGLRITVNGRTVVHPPLWPDIDDIARWGQWAVERAIGAEAGRLRELVDAHRAAYAARSSRPPRPAHAFKVVESPGRAVVENLQSLRISGWSTAVIDPMTVELGVNRNGNSSTLGAPFALVERQDVAAALALKDARVGFEVEVPGSAWALVGDPSKPLSLQLHIAGQPIGPVFTVLRDSLATTLDQAMAIGDPNARRQAALLALEHLHHAGRLPSLSLTQVAWLREITAGLRPAGWLDADAPPPAPAPLPPWRALPQPAAAARLLRLRVVAGLAYVVLQRARVGFARRLEVALTRGLGLFDRDYYLAQLVPDGELPTTALRHYIEVGQARGLSPMVLFDLGHYVRQLPGRQPPFMNPLLHYALWGRHRGLSPSAWFDEPAYLARNADVRRRGLDPLRHFHNHGFSEGRSPLPDFNPSRSSRDGVVQRLARQQTLPQDQPLLRYLQRGLPPEAPGLRQGRPPWFGAWTLDGRDFLSPAIWDDLPGPRLAAPGAAVVDIVVPVYAGHQESLRSLWAVLARPQVTPYELVVVDDCGPEPVLRDMLARLAARGLFTLLVNDANLGFVKSVNRGLALHPDRDVVILNADTRVHGDWLDRLMAQARATPDAASITPLSNNATVCSYPRTLDGNGELDEAASTALDAAAARLNAGVHVDVPTGVGFCMFMRRETMRAIGVLDAERFGRGYGEENDWCLRATQAGWRHLIAADIYVTHSGSISFGAEASPRVLEAMRLIRETFPDYPQRIEAYIAADPLRAARARLDMARLQAAAPGDWVLTVNHDRGGGTARHEREEGARLRERGLNVLALRPGRDAGVQLIAPDVLACPNLQGLPMAAEGLLAEVLALLPLREIHIHHLADFPDDTAACLHAWATRRGLKLVVTLHDYHMMCPRITFIGPDGRYCGEPDAAGCQRCLSADGLIERSGSITAWRARFEPLLRAAAEVRVPDADLAPRVARHWPGVAAVVRPHEPGLVIAPPHIPDHGVQHVLVIGALSPMKGLHVLKALAASSVARSAGMRFTLLGYSADDDGLRRAGVEVLGAYDDEQLPARIEALAPDLIFIPSIWPETYSYVLSAALRARRRVAVFDLGAPARRLRAADAQALLIPLALAERPDDLARMLSWGRVAA